jgi:hypothetical protein
MIDELPEEYVAGWNLCVPIDVVRAFIEESPRKAEFLEEFLIVICSVEIGKHSTEATAAAVCWATRNGLDTAM